MTFPARARATAERILETFPRRRAHAARWLGVEPAGYPRIYLVDDHAGMRARAGEGVPEWAVAVARRDDVLVFRLDRIGQGPTTGLDIVLTHETVHHVLTHLGGLPLPRWFEEGLCVFHAGVSYFEPDTTVERLAAGGRLPTFEETARAFRADDRSAAAAYKLGHAAVTYFVQEHGEEDLRRLLKNVAGRMPFEGAFQEATGETLAAFEARWRESVTPAIPYLLFIVLENFELALFCFAALLVAGWYVVWRFRREKALQKLDADVQ